MAGFCLAYHVLHIRNYFAVEFVTFAIDIYNGIHPRGLNLSLLQ